jgi:hypothetical protein
MPIDADGHVADDVLVDAGLALDLCDYAGGRIDFEHHIMRLAVLRDAIGEAAQAPVFGLDDPAVPIVHDLGGGFRQRVDLGLSQILTREKHMLIERHGAHVLHVGRSLMRGQSAAPLRLSSK